MKIITILLVLLIMIYYISNFKFPVPIDPNMNKKSEEIITFLTNEINIPYNIASSIVRISIFEEIDPFLIVSLIYTESSFNPKAKSKLGYYGLMQVKPKIDCIETNILYGIKILKNKINKYKDLETAIIKYKGYNISSDRGIKEKEKVFLFYSNIKEKYEIWRKNGEK